MAHWAQIDENDVVLQVLVCEADLNDPEDPESGESEVPPSFLTDVIRGNWVRTYYNSESYAGPGFVWNPIDGTFIPPELEPNMDQQRLEALEAFAAHQEGLNAVLVDEDANHWDAIDDLQGQIDNPA